MTLPPMPTHLNLPERSRAEVMAMTDRPTWNELIARHGTASDIPPGTIVWTPNGTPSDQLVGNGWIGAIKWLPEGPPPRASRLKHPGKVCTLTHHVRLSLSAQRPHDFTNLMSEIRRKVDGSLRGAAMYAGCGKSTVARMCDPDTAFSVTTGTLLQVLKVYGLEVRLTDAPHREADAYLLLSGNWAVTQILTKRKRALGMSLAQLASRAEVSLSTARRVVQGGYAKIEFGHVLRVFAALGFSPVAEDIAILNNQLMQGRLQMLWVIEDPTQPDEVREREKRRYQRMIDAHLLGALQYRHRGYTGSAPAPSPTSQLLLALHDLYGDEAEATAKAEAARHVAVARYFAELFGEDFNEEAELARLEALGIEPPTIDDPEL